MLEQPAQRYKGTSTAVITTVNGLIPAAGYVRVTRHARRES